MKAIIRRIMTQSRRILIAALFAIVLIGLLQAAAPLELALLVAGDMTAYMEAAMTLWVIAQFTRLRTIAGFLAALITRKPRVSRRRRVRKDRTPPAANDDDPAWSLTA